MAEFDFFIEVSEMMGFCKETCQDVSFVSRLLYQVLECIHLHDIYQVRYLTIVPRTRVGCELAITVSYPTVAYEIIIIVLLKFIKLLNCLDFTNRHK